MAIQLSGSLQLTGSLFVDGDPVVLANQTSSLNVASASFASTASFADAFTVAGEIVAQTLNVQQVTSSVVYSSGSNVFGNSVSNTQQFTGSLQVSGSTHYVLGGLGVGTTLPSYNLDIVNTTDSSLFQVQSTATANNTALRIGIDGNNAFINASGGSTGILQLRTYGSTKATLDVSGNLGLGVTPSAWQAFTGLQVGEVGSLSSNDFGSGNIQTILGLNTYYDNSGFKYIQSGTAAMMRLVLGGEFQWHQANTSGTAGNAISFTQAMTLNASGNLSIGNTNDTYKLDVSGTGRFSSGASEIPLLLTTSSTNGTILGLVSTSGGTQSWGINAYTNGNLYFQNGTIGAGANAVYFTSAGAGTFASSVTATDLTLSSASTPLLQIIDTTNSKSLLLGADDNNTFIRSSTSTPILLQVNGGDSALTLASTGAATFSSSVTTGGNITVTKTTPGLILNGLGSGNSGAYVNLQGWAATNSNWQIGVANIGPAGLLFIPSTTAGGTTFSSAVFTLSDAGAGTFASSVTAGSNIVLPSGYEVSWGNGNTSILGNTSTGYLDFRTSNSTKMYIDSDGNVGIGSTDPLSKLYIGGALENSSDAPNALTIKQTSTNETTGIYLERSGERKGYYIYVGGSLDSLNFQRNNAGTKEDTLTLTRDGNVGIGTTSPSDILHVRKSSSSNIDMYLDNPDTTNGNQARFIFRTTDSTGNTALNAGGIKSVWSNRSTNYVESDVIIDTRGTDNALVVKNNGNVGIGTTSPTDTLNYGRALDIQSSIGAAVYLRDLTDTAKYGLIAYDGESNNRTTIGAIGTDNYLRFVTVSTEAMRITSGGNVITGEMSSGGTYNPVANGWYLGYNGGGATVVNFSGNNEAFTFNQRDGAGTTQVDFRNGDVERGKIEWTTSGTTYNTSSDYRLKTNINPLTGALAKIVLLAPKTFNYIDGNGQLISGFIAHEVQEVVPEAVTGQKDELREDGTPKYQGMDHSRIVPFLVGAVQELKAEIDSLKAQLGN